MGWQPSWGTAAASGNGTSGRAVVRDVLQPLGVASADTYFTECYRRYLVKTGASSRAAAMDRAYTPFATPRGLPPASLPRRPSDAALVRMALEEDCGDLLAQLRASGADVVVTLGQPAADVLADLLDVDRVALRRDPAYGRERRVRIADRTVPWLPLKHPGQRTSAGEEHHRQWADGLTR
ncbi:MAG TPA: hypothetical protein VGH76_06080 [Actinomycetospora sp.]|uniref:hypothetical protein n=1 Tax=Actinomycetospora sp. TaxID=1872135 RepID=UPI002F40C66B